MLPWSRKEKRLNQPWALSRVQVFEKHGLKTGRIRSHLPTKPSLRTLWGAPMVNVPRAPRRQGPI